MTADPDPARAEGGPTVAGYLRDWLIHIVGRVRPKTLDGYRGLVRLYAAPALGELPLADVGPLDIQMRGSGILRPALHSERGSSRT